MHTLRLIPGILRRFSAVVLVMASAVLFSAPLSPAQSTAPAQPSAQQPAQPDQTAPEAAPDSGGPSSDSGVIALPKKKDNGETAPPAPAVPKFKNPEGTPNFSLRVEVPEVTVNVGVLLEKTQRFYGGLKPGNFRIYENGELQKVTGFKRVETPITALLLCEFARTNFYSIHDMRNAAEAFAEQLRPDDYVGLMTFDMNTNLVMDFTQDKQQLAQAIDYLHIPGFSDRNLFDALYQAEDRLSRIDGQKYIILIASGRNTFSKITLDKILAKVKATPDVTIFTISTGEALRAVTEGRGGFGGQMRDMDYLQADNEMKTFASLTGGLWFGPRFAGELPDIFKQINENIRMKYQLVYHPTNTKQDGTYRKLRVELVDDEGKPLRMEDEKHKPLKYDIIARDGYRAHQEVQ
ncbi:MAG: VWA domain-containing protein [Terracidiphilus sp.]